MYIYIYIYIHIYIHSYTRWLNSPFSYAATTNCFCFLLLCSDVQCHNGWRQCIIDRHAGGTVPPHQAGHNPQGSTTSNGENAEKNEKRSTQPTGLANNLQVAPALSTKLEKKRYGRNMLLYMYTIGKVSRRVSGASSFTQFFPTPGQT